jgi:hypothetical protein
MDSGREGTAAEACSMNEPCFLNIEQVELLHAKSIKLAEKRIGKADLAAILRE